MAFVANNLAGKTLVTHSESLLPDGVTFCDFSSEITYANLRETKNGFTLDVFKKIKQVNYPQVDGRRGEGKIVKDFSSASVLGVQVSKATGELLGSEKIVASTRGNSGVATAIPTRLRMQGKQLMRDTSEFFYGSYFYRDGHRPGVSVTSDTFAVDKGHVSMTSKSDLYWVDVTTGERTFDSTETESYTEKP